MAYCLPKSLSEKILEKVRSGEISPQKLSSMTSEQRRAYFAEFLGEENAKNTNSLFESKLLLKNKKRGLVTWAKTVTGLKPEIRRDLISRIERMDERILNPAEEDQFLTDLAERRLGFGVTEEEAQEIFNLSQEVYRRKAEIDHNSPNCSDSRLRYGEALVNFKNRVEEHKIQAAKKTLRERLTLGNLIMESSGTTKSLLASLDNSFFGRQGIKVLFNNPSTWVKGFMKSWGDIGRGIISGNAIDVVKAEVYSRENALNGTYDKMKIDIGLATEEAFPSALPEKIPLFGRLFRASEVAFNGGALRMRAMYADHILDVAKRNGVDITDPTILRDYGKLVNTMTGRGEIGKLGAMGKEINVLMFSIRFLKSNIDTLTMPLNSGLPPAVRKQSAVNLMRIVAGLASILAIAKTIDPESVELDPRSTDFGKIKVGNTRFDISGGLSSLITLAARLTPSYHDGEWGFYSKTTSGGWKDLTSGKFGEQTAMDVLNSFFQNKLSPVAGVVRDVWKGETFDFEKPTLLGELKSLSIPISLQNFRDLMEDKKNSPVLAGVIMEELGIGVSTYND